MKTSGISNAFARWMWPEPEETCTLDYMLANAKTGDILLWAASGSLWTPFWTDSPFSHVSLIYKDPVDGRLYQWQSTTHPQEVDLLTSEYNRNGVQLAPLRKSLLDYARKWGRLIAWRRLAFYIPDEEMYTSDIPQPFANQVDAGFVRTMEHTQGFGFQHDWRDMMGGRDFHLQYCPWPIGRPADFHHSIFCAALTALTLQQAGILHVGLPISNYSPASFAYRTEQMPYIANWGYSSTVKILFGKGGRSAT